MKAREIAELWHWRSRTSQLIQQGRLSYTQKTPQISKTLEEIIKLSVDEGFKNNDIPKPLGNDFPVFGKAYRDLNEQEFSIATSIAMERHFALNWVSGYSEDWDETPTDT
jgi:hypothetical protein